MLYRSTLFSGSSRARKESLAVVPKVITASHVHPAKSTPQLNDLMAHFERPHFSGGTLSKSLKWRGSVGNCLPGGTGLPLNSAKDVVPGVILGPGQVHPKGRLATPGRYGELQVGFLLIKGVLEIQVSFYSRPGYILTMTGIYLPIQINKARHFLPIDSDTIPDTYVKCYIKDGERLKYKKKTRVVRHSLEPVYQQCLKYQVRQRRWPNACSPRPNPFCIVSHTRQLRSMDGPWS